MAPLNVPELTPVVWSTVLCSVKHDVQCATGPVQSLDLCSADCDRLCLPTQHLPHAGTLDSRADERRMQVDVEDVAPPDPAVRIVMAKLEAESGERPLRAVESRRSDEEIDVRILALAFVEVGERGALEEDAAHAGRSEGLDDTGRGSVDRQPAGGVRETRVGRHLHG